MRAQNYKEDSSHTKRERERERERELGLILNADSHTKYNSQIR